MSHKHCHVCPWWMGYLLDNPLRYFVSPPKKILKPYLKEGMTVLDFGCGMGFFSINAAKIVGKKGKVISVDIQPKMLEILEKRAKRKKLDNIITTHLAQPDKLNLEAQADFALAMWMLHETPDQLNFLKQVRALLKEGSKFLVVEPSKHASEEMLKHEIESAEQAGFEFTGNVDAGKMSIGMLFIAK